MLRTTLTAALCALLCLTGTALAQITNIDDIQVYDAEGLIGRGLWRGRVLA